MFVCNLVLHPIFATTSSSIHTTPQTKNNKQAGNIMWARQLLRRIELPMARFAANAQLMAARESRRTVRLYNRVARALVEFEALWHAAWLKGIDAHKAGLAAPLLVRHPDTGQLLVNLDRDVMTLIRCVMAPFVFSLGCFAFLSSANHHAPLTTRLLHTLTPPHHPTQNSEAKYMLQLGAEVPEAARLLLLQEDKFKHYLAQLSQAVREYEAMLARVPPVLKPLLRPHLDDLERKVAPGLFVLTWSSVNIDGYIHRFKQVWWWCFCDCSCSHTHANQISTLSPSPKTTTKQGLARVEELVRKLIDLAEHRLEANLAAIRDTLLVDLPPDRSFAYDEFVAAQQRHQKRAAEALAVLNEEVARSVEDAIELVRCVWLGLGSKLWGGAVFCL
jgi:dynein heavy chain